MEVGGSKYRYRAFGLEIESVFILPELEPSVPDSTIPCDTKIVAGGEETFFTGDWRKGGLVVEPQSMRLAIRDVGQYQVVGGKCIRAVPAPGANLHDFRLYLLGTCFGVLLYQKGALPLHGCGVLGSEGGVVFCGESGIGKSTLALSLGLRGYPVLSDDVCCLRDVNEKFTLFPGYPQMKIHEKVMEYFRIDTRGLVLDDDTRKYFFPVPEFYHNEPCRLVKIVHLTVDGGRSFDCFQLEGARKYEVVVNNSYRGEYVKGLGEEQNFFAMTSKLAAEVQVLELSRPKRPFDPLGLVDTIEKLKLL